MFPATRECADKPGVVPSTGSSSHAYVSGGHYSFFIGRLTNMACHNLCIENKALVRVELLLGLGAKYCV